MASLIIMCDPMSRFVDSSRFLLPLIVAVALTTLTRAQSDYATPYYFTRLAGESSVGLADGSGSAVRFHDPSAVAVDASGNVYIADKENHTIRKMTPAGVVSTLAGVAGQSGATDGTGSSARFYRPKGIAADATGTLYVADTQNHTIRKITPAGVVTTLAGSPGDIGSVDGSGGGARFRLPAGIAVDTAGNVIVADTYNALIRKISPAGIVSTLAGNGTWGFADGPAGAAMFQLPSALTVDGTGNIYICEDQNQTIRKLTPAGVVSTVAGSVGVSGTADGTGGAARFNYPRGIVVDATGNLYVADTNNSVIRKIGPGGVVTTFAGVANSIGSTDGTGSAARFYYPEGVALDSAGNLWVADTTNQIIRKISPTAQTTTVAGSGFISNLGSVDGTGKAARFSGIAGLTIGPDGNLYVAEAGANVIRKMTTAGVVSTFAGSAFSPGSTDGASARFSSPSAITADAAGNLYVADSGNHSIRKITPAGLVSTLAGNPGVSGGVNGKGNGALFKFPGGIAVDAAGTVYVADTYNDTIRKVTSTGEVTTLAGGLGLPTYPPEGDVSRDGSGTDARFVIPQGLAIDAGGNLYVSEYFSALIRKITPAGVVSTLAGAYATVGSRDGPGSTARFSGPEATATDAAGNVYVADTFNCTIRMIAPNGVVTTLAGSPGVATDTDGLGPNATFSSPQAIVVDKSGAIYVASRSTVSVGRLPSLPIITTQPQNLSVTAGSNVSFSVVASGTPGPTYQWYFNGTLFGGGTDSSLSFSNARNTDAGDYTVVVTNTLGSATSAKATLTVTASTSPPPPSSGNNSGGGGGATSIWFGLALLSLATFRKKIAAGKARDLAR